MDSENQNRKAGRQIGQKSDGTRSWKGIMEDDGCYVHPSCLACPLPKCRYDSKVPKVLSIPCMRGGSC